MDTQQQKYWKVLLVGDHCLDIYHYGVCNRLSPEAPIPILKQSRVETKYGMSSNVKHNLQSFGINVSHVHNTTPIEKHRIVDSRFNHHLLRFDVGEDMPLKPMTVEWEMENNPADILVMSDYNKGFLDDEVITKLCELYKDKPIFVDSKKKDLSMFSGCYIKINEKEFNSLTNKPTDCEFIVTLGDKGALYNGETYPTAKTEVFDVCGAGDVFLSSLVYGYMKYNNIHEAIILANRCASYSVTKMGTYVLTKEEIKRMVY